MFPHGLLDVAEAFQHDAVAVFGEPVGVVSFLRQRQGVADCDAGQTEVYRLTAPPMAGPVVLQIQNALLALGYDPGTPDSVFGPHTQAAVVAFQVSTGLVGDGEVGAQTAAALNLVLPGA